MQVRDPETWNVLAEFVKTRYGQAMEKVLTDSYEAAKEDLVVANETKFMRLQGRAEALGSILDLFDALKTKGYKRPA